MSEYLAFENVVEEFSIIPETVQLNDDGSVFSSSAGKIIELPVEVCIISD